MPQQQGLPAWVVLNQANDTTASGMSDVYTNQPYQAGLVLGDYFDLTNEEAFRNCKPSTGVLYAGRYRRVQVDSGATASNVKTGTIGLMPSLAAIGQDLGQIGGANPPSMNVVTSYDQGIGKSTTVRPVVFLNTVTPGNYCWVQELGIASILCKNPLTAATPAIGDVVISTTNGLLDDPTQSTQPTYAQIASIVGTALDIPQNGKLCRVMLGENFTTLQD